MEMNATNTGRTLDVEAATQRSLSAECLPFLVEPDKLLQYFETATPSMDLLTKLKTIKLRLQAQVMEEMEQRAHQLQLWQNGWCRAWRDYEKALGLLTHYRRELGV